VDRIAAVAIGSNLGDRHSHLAFARAELARLLKDARFSSILETDPVDVPGEQPRFLNAAAVGGTNLAPGDLVRALLALESQRGRERLFVGAARPLDLDLILLGDVVIDDPDVVVPHPRFRGRRFVLEPLVEIAPDLRDPVTGRTVRELFGRLAPG
jgi:2-amino-4-hydroxy-6-hydroxymethyldihydropteridine diphosphokinase